MADRIFITPLYIYRCMGTVCAAEQQKKAEFTASFSANLRELFEYYKKVLQFLKSSRLFATESAELAQLVEQYLQDPKNFSKESLGLCAVDCVGKLHPLVYGSEVTREWLVAGCVRQGRFVQDFPFELLDFEECYRHYVKFLYLCSRSPDTLIVPNKLADFMWHAHMQDNYRYRSDSLKMLGRVLDHHDDLSPQEMLLHVKRTEDARKRLLRVPTRRSVLVPAWNASLPVSYHQYAFIDYGPGYCGGGSHPHYPHEHHHHPHQAHHNHHENKPQQESSHHNDSHAHHGGHTDHNNHSSCGGGASSCGGGGSSCGGSD